MSALCPCVYAMGGGRTLAIPNKNPPSNIRGFVFRTLTGVQKFLKLYPGLYHGYLFLSGVILEDLLDALVLQQVGQGFVPLAEALRP